MDLVQRLRIGCGCTNEVLHIQLCLHHGMPCMARNKSRPSKLLAQEQRKVTFCVCSENAVRKSILEEWCPAVMFSLPSLNCITSTDIKDLPP
jgi:hypothetical protein